MSDGSLSDEVSPPSRVVAISASSSTPMPASVAVSDKAFSDSSASSSSENCDNVGHANKPAWKKPLNGAVAAGHVMGAAVSWPALSESTKHPPKSASDSSKAISDPSVSTSQGPAISHSNQNPKHGSTTPNHNFSPNHTSSARQRPSKRGGGAVNGSMHSGLIRPPPPPPPPPLPPPFPLFDMRFAPVVAPVPESPIRPPPHYKGNGWEGRPMGGFVSQSHSVNDQSLQRNSSRRGNFGGRGRGDGLHHNSHGSRRDQDRDWNASRSSNARDVRLRQQMGPLRSFTRPPPPPPPPPPGSTPFVMPQHTRPFGNPMGFDMTSPLLYVPTLPPDSFRGAPFIAHAPPPPLYFPVPDPALPNLLVNQIDYYFSDANLVKDEFLRSKMDDEGWIPITLIASFPRVRQLTENVQFILDSLSASSVVEVQGNKVRRRNEWRKWLPVSSRFPRDPGSQSTIGSAYNNITTSFQKVTLDEATVDLDSIMGKADPCAEVAPSRSSSEGLTDHCKVANGEYTKEEAYSSQR